MNGNVKLTKEDVDAILARDENITYLLDHSEVMRNQLPIATAFRSQVAGHSPSLPLKFFQSSNIWFFLMHARVNDAKNQLDGNAPVSRIRCTLKSRK